MLALKLLVLACSLSGALADYPCLCAYAVETLIYDQPDTSSNVMGYMYEFDCKPVYQVDSKPDGWQTVATEHQIGYVENATTVEVQVCQGSVPDEDKVTTQVPPATTKIVTTPAPTPAPTQSPTTEATTAAVTTQAPVSTTKAPAPVPTTQAPVVKTEATTTQTPTTSTVAPTTKPTTTRTPSTTTLPTTELPTTKTTTPTTTTTTATPATTPKPTTTMTTTTSTTTTTTTPRPTTTTTTTTPKPTTTQYVPSCPSSVIRRSKLSYVFKHRSFCYEFRDSLADWYQARTDCQQNGGYLLTIHSQDEQNFVQSMLRTNLRKSNPIWLGLYDEAHEENWQWVSGLPLKYDNWMPGRFHDKYHSFENCGLYVPARMGQWDDVKCKGELFSVPAKHPWICQYRIQNSQATGPGH